VATGFRIETLQYWGRLTVHERGEGVAVEGDAAAPHLRSQRQRRAQPLPGAALQGSSGRQCVR
jgi:hypothetical protein